MNIVSKFLILMALITLAACNPRGTSAADPHVNASYIAAGSTIEFVRHGTWFEVAYAEWLAPAGVNAFMVTVNGQPLDAFQGGVVHPDSNGAGEGTTHSAFLVRQIDSNSRLWRVDVPALGRDGATYTLTIAGGGFSGTINNLVSVPFDRQGYAFADGFITSGGYTDEGLVGNATVFYVTQANMNYTLTGSGNTGRFPESGGTSAITGPTIFRFMGQVGVFNGDIFDRSTIPAATRENTNLNTTGNTSSNKMLFMRSARNVTFEGIGTNAKIEGWGIHIQGANNETANTVPANIVIRNITFSWPHDSAVNVHGGITNSGLPDRGLSHVWVHHNTFHHGQNTTAINGGSNYLKGDGSTDITNRARNVTVAYNAYIQTGKTILIGNNIPDTVGGVTVHHNWFQNSDSRHPRVRNGSVHVFNNIYDNITIYSIGAGHHSNIVAEGNIFRGGRRPFIIAGQGNDNGTLSGNLSGADEPGAIITSDVPNASHWAGRGLVPNAF
ncbi:MAG: hypothetical protein FWE37_08485, partial [Spirochaetaceae bacterium]|nr:hypothetical protein [Spirochaetaceae bacterium]